MILTQCPNCHRRCFTDATYCQSCLQTFKPGVLQAYAIAEEKSLNLKTNVLFLSLFLVWVAVLVVHQVGGFSAVPGN